MERKTEGGKKKDRRNKINYKSMRASKMIWDTYGMTWELTKISQSRTENTKRNDDKYTGESEHWRQL